MLVHTCANKEFELLQFCGAGPKVTSTLTIKEEKPKTKTRGKKITYDYDPVSNMI